MRFLSLTVTVFVFSFIGYCHGSPLNLDSLDSENELIEINHDVSGGDRRMLSKLDESDTDVESSHVRRKRENISLIVMRIALAAKAIADVEAKILAAEQAEQDAKQLEQTTTLMLQIADAQARLKEAKNERDRVQAQQDLDKAIKAMEELSGSSKENQA